MHIIRSITLFVFLFFTIDSIQGKSTTPPLHDIKDYIKYLLNLLEVENEYIRFLSYMKVPVPEDEHMKNLYDDLFSFDSYLSDLTTIYSKYYTLDDIIHLIQFYSSPLGKKTLKVNNDLNKQMEDIMLTKISEYIFTSTQNGIDILLPQIP